MKRTTTRRVFFKQAGFAAAVTAAAAKSNVSSLAADLPVDAIPPHAPLGLTGAHAYPSEHSIAAGDKLHLHLSSNVPYHLQICRLGLRMDDPAGDQVLFDLPANPPQPRPIHPGCYVHVGKGLRGSRNAMSLECWVRPWRTTTHAGLITQYDYREACGIGLFIGPEGTVLFYLGDGTKYRAEQSHTTEKNILKNGRWHHLAATWDGHRKQLWVDGKMVGDWEFEGSVSAPDVPIRLGAYGENGKAAHFLDGDLAMPAIHSRALSPGEIQARHEDRGLRAPMGRDLLACWPLNEERGDRVADVSRNKRYGSIINHGTWMTGGPSFKPDVARFKGYDPAKDPERGHSLRLASDDLYDCRWPVTHEIPIPSGARQGIYVARIGFELDGTKRLYHCTFIVRRAAHRKRAPILVVAATNTWRAYSGSQFAVTPPELKQVWGTRGIKNPPNNPPMFNLYGPHAAGQGTYQVGLRMPWPAAGPYVLYGGPSDYSHLMRADRFLHVWLEQSGYDFDVVSDLDLHKNPDLLRGYSAFIINGHNEYWSAPMYRGLERYLKGGGNLAVLSGNSLFWRVSFNEDCTVMECRKVDAAGEQVPKSRRGEAWHSQDGRKGGLLRECGFPGWKLIGLETLGWNNQSNPENFGPYLVDIPDHFLFNHPERVGVTAGGVLGQAPGGKLPMAIGHEFDVRLSTLKQLQELESPEGAEVPRDPPGILRIANGVIPWKKGGSAFDYFFNPIKPKVDQGGEMIYWERPDGGKVFNAGAIGFGWALLSDTRMQKLMRNVLNHFGVTKA